VLLLLRVTSTPAGAAAFSVTVPVDDVPPVTDVGLTLVEEMTTDASVTVSTAVCVAL